MYFFALLIYVFCFLFFISHRCDLNSAWLFFASARLILPFPILFERLKALSNSLNFASTVKPLYLYNKLSGYTFVSKLVIFSSLLSTGVLNIYFSFEINGRSLSLTISIFFDCFNFSLVLNGFYLSFFLVFSCFYLFFKSFAKRIIRWIILDANIFSQERCSYLLILPDDQANIFANSLVISYCEVTATGLEPRTT